MYSNKLLKPYQTAMMILKYTEDNSNDLVTSEFNWLYWILPGGIIAKRD